MFLLCLVRDDTFNTFTRFTAHLDILTLLQHISHSFSTIALTPLVRLWQQGLHRTRIKISTQKPHCRISLSLSTLISEATRRFLIYTHSHVYPKEENT